MGEKIILVNDFNLKHTIECGQIFRWDLIDGWYYITTRDKILKVKQAGNSLIFDDSVDSRFVKHYFRLDEDYSEILQRISRDRYIKSVIKQYSGLRLIRQDSWECLISYICSSASNIPRIKQNINTLSRQFGKKISLGAYSTYSFPDSKSMHLHRVKKCGLGFRDNYVSETSNKITEHQLAAMKHLNYAVAKQRLIQLPGVGPKIADCVLLYSMDFHEAFPVDTWMKKIMIKYYMKRKADESKIIKFAQGYFGDYAGYAQQFLYHYARNNRKLFF